MNQSVNYAEHDTSESPLHYSQIGNPRGSKGNSDSRVKQRIYIRSVNGSLIEQGTHQTSNLLPIDTQAQASVEAFNDTDTTSALITRNLSLDLPFEQAIDPYHECEHGFGHTCAYCIARASQACIDLPSGFDTQRSPSVRFNAAQLLRESFSQKNYQCKPLIIGTHSDPYPVAEKQHQITRQLLEVYLAFKHPVAILTNSNLICRDIDLLAALAKDNLLSVYVRLASIDDSLQSKMEPRSGDARSQLQTIRTLTENNIPVCTLIAPIIPTINDAEIESLLSAVKQAGAKQAAYVMARVPQVLQEAFGEWLQEHFPDRKTKVFNILRENSTGKLYDARFSERMSGKGIFAELIRQRFRVACNNLKFDTQLKAELNCFDFQKPGQQQLEFELVNRA